MNLNSGHILDFPKEESSPVFPSLVIARFNEDTDWTKHVAMDHNRFLYNKGDALPHDIPLPNFGREAGTYLRHICIAYHGIRSDTIFCQGNPFDHCQTFLNDIKDSSNLLFGNVLDCTVGGAYDQRSLVHEYCRVFGLPIQSSYRFVAGAQFRVTAEQIHSHPREFYTALFWATFTDPEAAYTLERLWVEIFGIE